jgi:hypothetical protein
VNSAASVYLPEQSTAELVTAGTCVTTYKFIAFCEHRTSSCARETKLLQTLIHSEGCGFVYSTRDLQLWIRKKLLTAEELIFIIVD